MPRDDLYLFEIIESSDHICDFLGNMEVDRWIADEMLRSAVLQKLTVIGEAARGIDATVKARYPLVPWSRIIAFRNVAVHEYFAIEWPTVWPVATREVPELRAQVLDVLRAEFPEVARRYEESGEVAARAARGTAWGE